MACSVSIKKNMGSFSLDMQFQTEAKRLGILGESGAGKSMCLKAIAGILKPDEGEIYIGENCVFSKERKLNLPPQKRKVGYLFQSYALFPQVAKDFFEYRNAQSTGVALSSADKKSKSYPV